MFLFQNNHHLVYLLLDRLFVINTSTMSIIETIQLHSTVELAQKYENVIYFTCSNSFHLYSFDLSSTSSSITSQAYTNKIVYFYIGKAVLVVVQQGLQYSNFIANSNVTTQLELKTSDIPYYCDVNSSMTLYFQTKVIQYSIDKEIMDIKSVYELPYFPSSIHFIKSKWYAVCYSSIYVSKNGYQWSLFKQTPFTSFDETLEFIQQTMHQLSYNQISIDSNNYSCCSYYKGQVYLANASSIINFHSSAKLVLNSITMDNEDKATHIALTVSKDIGGLNERDKAIVLEKIGQPHVVISFKTPYSASFLKKIKILKDFIESTAKFETIEHLCCMKIVYFEHLSSSKSIYTATLNDYQHKMKDFKESKLRMMDRIDKLDFEPKKYQSELINQLWSTTDALLQSKESQQLIQSQRLLLQSAFQQVNADCLKQEKLLLCNFEKINNENICLEYNLEKINLQLHHYFTVCRAIGDCPLSKLVIYITKGKPKFRKMASNDSEKLFCDYCEELIKLITSLAINRLYSVSVESRDFKFSDKALDLVFYPSETILSIQKQIRTLEDQYGADKEEILGLEHSINILEWEMKIHTILHASLQSDYLEASSLKPKKSLITGYEHVDRIEKEFKVIDPTLNKQKILNQLTFKNTQLHQQILELKDKRQQCTSRQETVVAVSHPLIDYTQFEQLKLFSDLKFNTNELMTRLETNIGIIKTLVHASRPLF